MKSFVSLSLLLIAGALMAVPKMPVRFVVDVASVRSAAAKVQAGQFPDADRVIIDDHIHTRFEPDGSDVTWDDEWVMALTEKGCRSLSHVQFDYSERYGSAGIDCVEIMGVDGIVRKVDFARTLKVATDNSSMGSNIVDPLDKIASCAVPGISVGETRHVRIWRKTRRARMRDSWADMNLLEATQPILATTVSVDQPAGRPVLHAVVRNPFGKTVTRAPDEKLAGGRTLLSWTVRNVPQAFPEPDMPPISRTLQGLRLSTIADWLTVSRWYWSICERHLAKTTPAMTDHVAALVKNCRTEAERVRAIFKFVSQEIRYMGLTLEDDAPGYEPHDVNITFDNRYGVCRDKAGLLVAMLRLAGVKAFPVLINVGAKMDPEVPMPYFNHAIVAVEPAGAKPGAYVLMDPTNETTKDLCPAYLSDKSYLVARPEGEKLLTSAVTPVERNLLRVASEGALDGNGALLLTSTFTFSGISDGAIRGMLLRKTPDERRTWFANILRGASVGAELLSVEVTPADLRDTTQPLAAKTVARLPECILRGDTRDTLALPFITRVLNFANGQLDETTTLEKRRFPLVMSMTAGAEETLRLNLGTALGAVKELPPPIDIRVGGYVFRRACGCTNGVFTARRVLRLEDVNFDVPAYAALRNARQETETAERAEPQFVSRADADAHQHIRKEICDIQILSPTSWVQTNVVEKEILTYKGKKSASELKFFYAPTTRAVKLVSATVSNRDGKTFPVTAKEVNEMDCDWAAAAPRYPASKIQVVNLPAVEIGSVIRYTVARTVTNAPIAQAFSYSFGESDPVDLERVTIRVPDGVPFVLKNDRFLKKDGTPRYPRTSFTVTTNAGERVFCWTARRPVRTPSEPSIASAELWRPTFSISTAAWAPHGEALVDALAAARAAGSDAARQLAKDLVKDLPTPQARITAIRSHLMQHLRRGGPGIFELPFAQAFSAPDRALADSYASGTDWMNLAYVMLEAAGFDCSFVLATDDPYAEPKSEAKRRAMPRPQTFDSLVIKAVWRSGWVPFLRDETTFWVAGENKYAPVEASSHLGESFYDPQRDAFGRIPAPTNWVDRTEGRVCLDVRVNGAVDFSVTNRLWGTGVGGMRLQFTENLLPEVRYRFHQRLLSGLAQNATATSELVTDVKGYPFMLSFAAYAEGFAVMRGDTATVQLPAFEGSLFPARTAGRRTTPVSIGGQDEDTDVFEVIFPEGYTEIESQPPSFTVCNPKKKGEVWVRNEVSSRVEGGRLHVTVKRSAFRPQTTVLGADYDPFLKNWNTRASSLEARMVTARRRTK